MKLAIATFGIAALVGIGYVIGKKSAQKKMEEEVYDFDDFCSSNDDNQPDVSVYAKEKYGNKIRKASLFAVGAIKTGADKIGETIQDIKTKDMVKKGEKTVDAVKDAGGNIKNDIKRDIEDLKGMVASINDETSDLAEQTVDNVFETSQEVSDEVRDIFGSDSEE